MKATFVALALALPGLAHNTVHIENESAKSWHLEPVQLQDGGGAATAGLVVSCLDRATGQYVLLKPGADGRFPLPAKGRIALDTEAPLASEDDAVGASYHFRLFDEADRSDPGSVLYYTVSWYFACRAKAPCKLRRSVRIAPYGELLKKLVQEISSAELRITAAGWPD